MLTKLIKVCGEVLRGFLIKLLIVDRKNVTVDVAELRKYYYAQLSVFPSKKNEREEKQILCFPIQRSEVRS